MLSQIQAETEAVAQAALASLGAWEAREARPVVRGVCIDSAHSLDRDDAIWFEEMPNGRLRVDVTIADVASFVSKDSLLDKVARQKVESEYGAETVIEPMLPFRLSQDDGVEGNGVFSLSDRSIRAGVTSRIIVDVKRHRLESLEIFASLIHPEIVNYNHVSEAIEQEPQGRFAKWASYTALLKKIRTRKSEGVLPMILQEISGKRLTHLDAEGVLEELSESEAAASKMVEETALLANRANAQFFAACGLPYLFRVHQVQLEGVPQLRAYHSLAEAEDARQALLKTHQSEIRLVLDRATYAPHRLPHAGLGELAYSHVTSPIRRYADLPNQRMQHWLSEIIAELRYVMSDFCLEIEDKDLVDFLGKLSSQSVSQGLSQEISSGAKLLGWLGRLRIAERESIRRHCRQKLQKYLVRSLQQLLPAHPLEKHHRAAQMMTERLSQRINPAPYRQAEMEQLAREINLHQASRHLSEREKLAQKLLLTQVEQQLELAELQVLNALEIDDHALRVEKIAQFSAEKRLPLVLHLSAKQGKEYRVPAAELLQRMQEGRLREPSDLATILVQMKLPEMADALDDPAFSDDASQEWLQQNIENWQRLKEAALARFAANPSFTKGFLKYLEERYAWQIHSTHASLIGEGAIVAIMSINPQPDLPSAESAPLTLFSPHFSIGHWGKTTRHHARLSLLRGLAFDQMLAADEIKLPRALRYMTAAGFEELASPDSNICQLLEEKAMQAGIEVQADWDAEVSSYRLTARKPQENRAPIDLMIEAKTEPMARALAWQNLLRSKLMRPVHEELFRKRECLRAIPINADEAIKWLGGQSPFLQQNLQLSSTNQHTQRREPIWQARLTLALHGTIHRSFIGLSTQAEVASTFANEAGLRYLRERADYGDRVVEAALQDYEKTVLARYAQGEHLSSKVPYMAKMNGREIIAV